MNGQVDFPRLQRFLDLLHEDPADRSGTNRGLRVLIAGGLEDLNHDFEVRKPVEDLSSYPLGLGLGQYTSA